MVEISKPLHVSFIVADTNRALAFYRDVLGLSVNPARPELVHPSKLSRRGLGSERGRLALIHAIAHIEFNAINLGLDAALRFPGMPGGFYRDWLSVAASSRGSASWAATPRGAR